MSFGFGVGDIIAAVSVIKRLTASLRDSTGSSADYQALARQIESVEQAVENARALAGSQEQVETEVERCLQLSRQFHERTQPYRDSLSTTEGSGNRVKDAWVKAKWVYKRAEAVELRNGLQVHMDALNIQLAILKEESRGVPQSINQFGPDFAPISLVTALDDRILMPYELCREWKKF
ncbi:hypothetical protein K440DRAFT_419950 [Wilcoxina mikolae CBS 423.85]|nr:hypothetical protein K440DRAFT_419950 [Wilcoxina mikolae CBS 423.85]